MALNEPDAYTESLETDILEKPIGEAQFGASPAEGAIAPITSPNKDSQGTLLLQTLRKCWVNTPEHLGIVKEEERKKWYAEHTFVHYLGTLIILDILVLNDRALDLTENFG